MAANSLPVPVITHILQYLSVPDRQEAALVNKQWYDASNDPILLQDTVVTFTHHSPTDASGFLSGFGRKRSPHLVLDNVDGSTNSRLLLTESSKYMSENLLSLSLKGSSLMESTFISMMSNCRSLQKLDISCCNSLFMSGKLLSSSEDQKHLSTVLQHVAELNMASIRFLSDVTFNRMLAVCPQVQSLSLAGNVIVFYTDSYHKNGTISTSLLTFKNIMAWILKRKEKLKSLNFSHTAISDEVLDTLASVPGLALDEINLMSCKELTDEGISIFTEKQAELKKLDISENPELGDKAMMAICHNLSSLKSLNVHKCRRITDSGVAALSWMFSLETVNLSSCYMMSPKGLRLALCGQKKLQNLTRLNLNSCSQVKDAFIMELCKALPHLLHLDVGSCTGITDIGVLFISKYMKRLELLRFGWCRDITDEGLLGLQHDKMFIQAHQHEHVDCKCCHRRQVPKLLNLPSVHDTKTHHTKDLKEKVEAEFAADEFPHRLDSLGRLQVLDLTACSKITDIGIVQVMQFTELRVLHLTMCPEITDKSLVTIASKLRTLQELYLSQCVKITDMGVIYLTEWLKRLTVLDLSSCDELTNKSLDAIFHNCKRLHHLDVSMCSGMTLECVEVLEHNMTHLHTVKKRLVGGGDNLGDIYP